MFLLRPQRHSLVVQSMSNFELFTGIDHLRIYAAQRFLFIHSKTWIDPTFVQNKKIV
jgi:hypothetical protein